MDKVGVMGNAVGALAVRIVGAVGTGRA